jgi:hypothetical protein
MSLPAGGSTHRQGAVLASNAHCCCQRQLTACCLLPGVSPPSCTHRLPAVDLSRQQYASHACLPRMRWPRVIADCSSCCAKAHPAPGHPSPSHNIRVYVAVPSSLNKAVALSPNHMHPAILRKWQSMRSTHRFNTSAAGDGKPSCILHQSPTQHVYTKHNKRHPAPPSRLQKLLQLVAFKWMISTIMHRPDHW